MSDATLPSPAPLDLPGRAAAGRRAWTPPGTWRLLALLSVVLLSFVSQQPAIIVAGTLVVAAYALVTGIRARVTPGAAVVFAGVCLLFSPAFLKAYHGLSPAFYAFATVMLFFAARAASRHPAAAWLAALRMLYLASVAGITVVLVRYWGQPEPFGMVIPGSSTNGIPAYLIVVQIGLTLANWLVHRRLPLLSPFATGAVAFFGNGRGSLVVAALIIAGSLLINLAPGGRSRPLGRIAFLAVFAAIVAVLVVQGEELFDLVSRYTKLSVGLADSNRLEIWEHYSRKLDGPALLIGADYAGTIVESLYNGNPHVAYIRTHSFFGLGITLLALASPLAVLFVRKTLRAQAVFLYFIALAALRAASEPIFFPTLLDFYYFSYFFLYVHHAPDAARPGRAR